MHITSRFVVGRSHRTSSGCRSARPTKPVLTPFPVPPLPPDVCGCPARSSLLALHEGRRRSDHTEETEQTPHQRIREHMHEARAPRDCIRITTSTEGNDGRGMLRRDQRSRDPRLGRPSSWRSSTVGSRKRWGRRSVMDTNTLRSQSAVHGAAVTCRHPRPALLPDLCSTMRQRFLCAFSHPASCMSDSDQRRRHLCVAH